MSHEIPEGFSDSWPEKTDQVVVRPAVMEELSEEQNVAVNSNIQLLMDVPLNLTVELGRTRRMVKDILSMGVGSLIELDKLAGEAVDVLVNGHPIAKGEVVVIDENFGIRVTEILEQEDRIKQLK